MRSLSAAFAAACLLAAPAIAGDVSPLLGLPPLPATGDTPAMATLGEKLFFDRRLSVNGTMSCGLCHIPAQGFAATELRTPVGIEGKSLRRNAPTLLNVAFYQRLFLDGRSQSLEAQAWEPMLAPAEMGNETAEAVVSRVAALPDYAPLFAAAFDAGPGRETIGRALAVYERTLVSGGSRFDRWWFGGEGDAVTAEEREGFALFRFKAGCAQCHQVEDTYALFTDQRYHNIGTGKARADAHAAPTRVELIPGLVTSVAPDQLARIGDPPQDDRGREEVTGDRADRWKYRTPSLRNVALTAPYMHDGSLATLEEVVAFYDRGGGDDPAKAEWLFPLRLTDTEKRALVAFLKTLTGTNAAAPAKAPRP